MAAEISCMRSVPGLALETKASASVFTPIVLDVSALAPGRYTAVLDYEGQSRRVRIIKY